MRRIQCRSHQRGTMSPASCSSSFGKPHPCKAEFSKGKYRYQSNVSETMCHQETRSVDLVDMWLHATSCDRTISICSNDEISRPVDSDTMRKKISSSVCSELAVCDTWSRVYFLDRLRAPVSCYISVYIHMCVRFLNYNHTLAYRIMFGPLLFLATI